MMLFCFLTGSVLGVRMPSVAGQMKRTGWHRGLECRDDSVAGGGGADVAADAFCGDGGGARGQIFAHLRSDSSRAINAKCWMRPSLNIARRCASSRSMAIMRGRRPVCCYYKGAPGNLIQQMIDAAIAANPRAAKYHLFKAEQ
jgi:hypothetical protein